MQPDTFIFTALSDNIRHLHPHLQPGSAPLSAHEVGRLLKFYGRRAGLDPNHLHVHVLRHTAYMLYTNGGADVRFCSKLLHHSSLATTTRYDHVMAGQRNTEWAKAVSQLPGLAAGPLFQEPE